MQQWASTVSFTMGIKTIAHALEYRTLSSRKACPTAISARGLPAQGVGRYHLQPHKVSAFTRPHVSAPQRLELPEQKITRPRLDCAPWVETSGDPGMSCGFRLTTNFHSAFGPGELWISSMAYCSTLFHFQLRLNEGMCSDWEKVNADPGAIEGCFWCVCYG